MGPCWTRVIAAWKPGASLVPQPVYDMPPTAQIERPLSAYLSYSSYDSRDPNTGLLAGEYGKTGVKERPGFEYHKAYKAWKATDDTIG